MSLLCGWRARIKAATITSDVVPRNEMMALHSNARKNTHLIFIHFLHHHPSDSSALWKCSHKQGAYALMRQRASIWLSNEHQQCPLYGALNCRVIVPYNALYMSNRANRATRRRPRIISAVAYMWFVKCKSCCVTVRKERWGFSHTEGIK